MLCSGKRTSLSLAIGSKNTASTLGDQVQRSTKHGTTYSTVWPNMLFRLPTLELNSLYLAENIRIEPEYMRQLGREDIGVRIPGEDGYIGTLNVYHELHCLVS